MDINAWLKPPSSQKVIGGISCPQGVGVGVGRVWGGPIERIGSNRDWVDSGRI